MSKRIKGITIELDGDTKGLDKALKDVTKESRDIQKELRDVDRLLKFNPKNVELLAQKKKLLADQVENTRKRLDQLKSAQDQVTKAFENGEISEKQYRDFQKEIAETESKLQHYENQLKSVDKSHRSFGEKMAAAGKTVKEFGQGMTSVGKEMSMKVTAPLVAIGGVATKLGMDFKAGLSEVQALSGATADELANLEERSRELGASTKFSAKEVTEGFKYMALAGWDVQQSLDGIDGVLNLAAASGEDLGRVSDILTDSISAFGDEAKDAGRYADVLAAASSNANTDVSGLGEAFKMVAPVAGALGYSLEDTSVALGLMANAGVKGSAAGTALRSALTNLVKPTKAMKDEMKKLGINVKDSNGEMKPLDTLLGDLRGSFGKLTEAEKASSAATIFGKEAMSGMLAVINAGDADFNKLTKAIANSEGVAEEMADTMQNNLQGKLTNLKSALEELAIKIFDALEPALTAIVDSFQSLVDWLNGFSKETQTAIVAIAALVAGIGPLLVVLGTMLTMAGTFMTVLPAIVPLITALAAPIGVIIASLTALGVAYALLKTDADEAYKAQLEMAESNLELAESQKESIEETGEQIDKTSDLIAKTKEQMETTDALVDSFEGLMEKSKLTTKEFGDFLTLQTELEHTKSPERIAELEGKMEKLREKSGLSKEEFNKLLESNSLLTEQFPQAGDVIDEYGNKIADTTGKLREMTEAELERMQIEVYNEMIEGMQEVNKHADDYNQLLHDILALKDSEAEKELEIKSIKESINSNDEEIAANNERILEIQELKKDASLGEYLNLDKQKNELQTQNYELDQQNTKNQKNLETIEETLGKEKEELKIKEGNRDMIGEQISKNRENYDMYLEILSSQYDINLEKGKENKALDQATKKRSEEIKKLETIIKNEGDSNGKSQDKIDKLKGENKELENVKTKIDAANKSLDNQNGKYEKGNENLSKAYGKASELGDGINSNVKKAELFNKEMGKDLKKDINVKQSKNPEDENRKWSSPIKKTIDVVTKGLGKLKFWAEGTNYHPGGKAVLGEEGPELVNVNGRMSLASFGMYDLPVGAKVYPHEDTVDMLRSGLVDGIGRGVAMQQSRLNPTPINTKDSTSSVERLLSEQNRLLTKILDKDTNIIVDDKAFTDKVNENNALDEIGKFF